MTNSSYSKPNNKPKSKRKFNFDPDVPLTDKQKERVRQFAWNSCSWYLSRSDKTRKELFDKMNTKGVPEEIINDVLDELEQRKYVDDERYTENFIRSKQEYDKLGVRAISQKLLQKGVPRDVIQEALADVDEDEEYNRALAVAKKSLRSSARLEPQKRLNRIVGQLARKGFSSSASFKAAKEALAEEGETIEVDESFLGD